MSEKQELPPVQTLKEWERQAGIVINDDVDLDQVLDKEAFTELWHNSNYTGVDHDVRAEWLQDNGYDVTRENMVNADLPNKFNKD